MLLQMWNSVTGSTTVAYNMCYQVDYQFASCYMRLGISLDFRFFSIQDWERGTHIYIDSFLLGWVLDMFKAFLWYLISYSQWVWKIKMNWGYIETFVQLLIYMHFNGKIFCHANFF